MRHDAMKMIIININTLDVSKRICLTIFSKKSDSHILTNRISYQHIGH